MPTRTLAGAAALAILLPLAVGSAAAAPAERTMIVHKDPLCGCCTAWAEQMEAAGFVVEARPTSLMAQVKAALGVPGALASCHTAEIDGYVVEGHVPVSAIEALLAQRPKVDGIAVPGMPMGSPGMETPGFAPEPYQVVLFGAEGSTVLGTWVGSERLAGEEMAR
ncbi:DUF411 domain-containing protein [Salinarimonas sp. NSM]|uniref:DUF411 domain-containing protein n=1 Tax=Salinarimonas sp. NSM TaxID=3458003 RepID=UPI0040368A62